MFGEFIVGFVEYHFITAMTDHTDLMIADLQNMGYNTEVFVYIYMSSNPAFLIHKEESFHNKKRRG